MGATKLYLMVVGKTGVGHSLDLVFTQSGVETVTQRQFDVELDDVPGIGQSA